MGDRYVQQPGQQPGQQPVQQPVQHQNPIGVNQQYDNAIPKQGEQFGARPDSGFQMDRHEEPMNEFKQFGADGKTQQQQENQQPWDSDQPKVGGDEQLTGDAQQPQEPNAQAAVPIVGGDKPELGQTDIVKDQDPG